MRKTHQRKQLKKRLNAKSIESVEIENDSRIGELHEIDSSHEDTIPFDGGSIGDFSDSGELPQS